MGSQPTGKVPDPLRPKSLLAQEAQDDAQAQAAQAEAQAEIERRERENEAKRRQVDSNEQKAKVYAESHPDVAADLITAWVKESMANGNNNKK